VMATVRMIQSPCAQTWAKPNEASMVLFYSKTN
jgi:hypothetical protein